jgi:hypothetical protein
MPISGTMAAVMAATAGAGVGSSLIGANAAGKAANAQANAATQAANLQSQSAANALAFQKQQWEGQQAAEAPFLQAGQGAVRQLSADLQPGGSLMQPFGEQFQAPTGLTEQNDPGFKARLAMGQQALERSAAARGDILSGGTAKALTRYGQDYGSNEYANVYGRALGEYQQRYNIFQQQQANTYNRLAGLSGAGQVAAGQLGAEGAAASGNIANTYLGSSSLIGNSLQNAGAARASGYMGVGNALAGGLNSLAGAAWLPYLNQLYQAGGAGGGVGSPWEQPGMSPWNSLYPGQVH